VGVRVAGNVRELKHGLESTVFPSNGAILSERPPAIQKAGAQRGDGIRTLWGPLN